MSINKIARIGDTHDCPKCGKNVIVSASNSLINGRGIATVGSKTECGATIISGSSVGSVNGKAIAHTGSKTDHGGVIVTGTAAGSIKT